MIIVWHTILCSEVLYINYRLNSKVCLLNNYVGVDYIIEDVIILSYREVAPSSKLTDVILVKFTSKFSLKLGCSTIVSKWHTPNLSAMIKSGHIQFDRPF